VAEYPVGAVTKYITLFKFTAVACALAREGVATSP